MPVLLFRGDMHDVAGDDDLLLRLRGDDAFARGHEQHLITAVRVHLVTRTRAEVDDAQIEVLARLGREQRLARHRTAGEQGSVHRLSWNLARSVYLHGAFSSRAIVPTALLAGVYLHFDVRATQGAREMDGAVAIIRAYKHLLDESVARFPFPKLVVSDYEGRWQDCYARILGFLD